MAWSRWLTLLGDVLGDLYPTQADSRRVLNKAAIPRLGLIRFNDAPYVNWSEILNHLVNQSPNPNDPRPRLVEAVLDAALADFPDHPILKAAKIEDAAPVKGPDIGRDLSWKTDPAAEGVLEKIIGAQSTLLPIRFLEIGLTRARAVCRVVLGDGSAGTGFLIGSGWLMTNNHVFPAAGAVRGAKAEFNYEETVAGLAAPVDRYEMDPSRFATSKNNDWSVVGIDAAAETKWGTLALDRVQPTVGSFVNIIQHPAGGPKKIGLYHNTVAYVGQGRVQYLTDTLPGSSGSPVFNDDWKVVALHHSGGMLREPGTKSVAYRNEGIMIPTVLDDLAAAGVQIPPS